jgi:hypothetical protein
MYHNLNFFFPILINYCKFILKLAIEHPEIPVIVFHTIFDSISLIELALK